MDRHTYKLWDQKQKVFHDLGFGLKFNGELIMYHEGGYIKAPKFLGDDCTVIQFTGRTDSKDKEIFEGDILMARGEKGTVKWETDRFIVYSNALGLDVSFPLHSYSSQEMQVIGNIYQGEEVPIIYGTAGNETA